MNRTSIKKLTFLITLLLVLMTTGSALADNSTWRMALFAPAVVENDGCNFIVNPGQSIQAAVESAQSGQIVCVRAGTYNEQVKIQPPDSGITLMAYPGERPIIDGRGVLPGTTANNQNMGLVHISGSNVIVDGFDVRNSAIRGVNVVQAPNTTVALHDVIVRNLVVHGSQEMGINVNGDDNNQPYNILVENNEVYDNLLNNADGHEGGSALTFIEVKNSTARGNVVYHNIGEGLVAGRFSENITLEANTSYDNQHANLYLVNTTNPVVRRNYVYCTDDRTYWSVKTPRKPSSGLTVRDEDFEKLSVKPGPSSGQVIINNIVVGCGINFGVSTQISGGGLNNALVANNTFVNARGDSGASINNVRFEGDVSLRNTRFVNNLILQEVPGSMVRILTALGDPDLATFQLADNLYSHPPENDWPTNETGRIVADPKLVSPSLPVKNAYPNPANYGLQSNSPAINAGTAVSQVTNDFFGQGRSGALDIGADERDGAPPATGQIIVVMETIPVGDPQVFQFSSNFAGAFELTHAAEKAAELSPGTYNVSLIIPTDWLLSSVLCSDGSQPAAINLAAGETVICTFIGLKQTDDGGDGDLAAKIYLATAAAGSVGGVSYSPGDIVVYDGPSTSWSLFFDGSDVGLSKPINEFEIMGDGSLLMALNGTNNLTGPNGTFKLLMQDVARFRPTSTGPTTAGTWELYFDGSDVGLSTSAEKIDALGLRSDGALLISTMGKASVPGGSTAITGQDEDLLAFKPSATGGNTAGAWSLAFDGSQLAGMNTEDMTAAWQDAATGTNYVAVMDDFTVKGVSGTNRTILAVTSSKAVSIYWNAADAGFPGPIDALEIVFTP